MLVPPTQRVGFQAQTPPPRGVCGSWEPRAGAGLSPGGCSTDPRRGLPVTSALQAASPGCTLASRRSALRGLPSPAWAPVTPFLCVTSCPVAIGTCRSVPLRHFRPFDRRSSITSFGTCRASPSVPVSPFVALRHLRSVSLQVARSRLAALWCSPSGLGPLGAMYPHPAPAHHRWAPPVTTRVPLSAVCVCVCVSLSFSVLGPWPLPLALRPGSAPSVGTLGGLGPCSP